MADPDWDWAKEIDRSLLEPWLKLDNIREHCQLVIIGTTGPGKTIVINDLARIELSAGQTVMFRQGL